MSNTSPYEKKVKNEKLTQLENVKINLYKKSQITV